MQDLKQQMVGEHLADEEVLSIDLGPQVPTVSTEQLQVARAAIQEMLRRRSEYGNAMYKNGYESIRYWETFFKSPVKEEREKAHEVGSWVGRMMKQPNEERARICRSVFSLILIEYYIDLGDDVGRGDVSRLLDHRLKDCLFEVVEAGKGMKMYGRWWRTIEDLKGLSFTFRANDKFKDLLRLVEKNERRREKEAQAKWSAACTITFAQMYQGQTGLCEVKLPQLRSDDEKRRVVRNSSVLYWHSTTPGVTYLALALGGERSFSERQSLYKFPVDIDDLQAHEMNVGEAKGDQAKRLRSLHRLFRRSIDAEAKRMEEEEAREARKKKGVEPAGTAVSADAIAAPVEMTGQASTPTPAIAWKCPQSTCGKEFAKMPRENTIKRHESGACSK